MTPLVALLLASQPLPVFPGAELVPIAGGLSIGGAPSPAGYFVAAAPLREVAGYFLRAWELRGLPTTADGDLLEEGVISAFHLLEGEVVAVVLRREGDRTVALCVVRDLTAAARAEGPIPCGEGRSCPAPQVFVADGSLSDARSAVGRAARARGFEERALSLGRESWVIEHVKGTQRALTALTALPQGRVLVWQLEQGEGR